MYRIIIAGTRDFNDYELLKKTCDRYLAGKAESGEEIVIVSGGAPGADALGARYARERGLRVLHYPAQWGKYGRKAGPMRNTEMAENADALLAFWDGKSRGTGNMIQKAEKRGLKVEVVKTANDGRNDDMPGKNSSVPCEAGRSKR